MRIRKYAAKLLLGSGCSHHSPPPAPPTSASAAADTDTEGLYLCQLNCSPWDVVDSTLDFFGLQEDEEEEGKVIMGNEHILGVSESKSSVAAEEEEVDPKKVKKRRRRRKKEDNVEDENKKAIVTVSAGEALPGCCKKNDGKGWHCKRPANPQHTLCDHHLNQLKSYGTREYGREVEAADGDSDSQLTQVKNKQKPDAPRVKNRKPKTPVAAVTSESAADGYYYYSGFGPWRGKSRSNGKTVKVKEEEEEEEKNESESRDESDAPVAGDDIDDDSSHDDEENDGNVGNNRGRVLKKRGRKPIKARSLKSLL